MNASIWGNSDKLENIKCLVADQATYLAETANPPPKREASHTLNRKKNNLIRLRAVGYGKTW
jgi:hypothetical protein